MNDVLTHLAKLTDDQLDLAPLRDNLNLFDFQKELKPSHIPAIENPKNYARNILMLHPIEVVVLHWPPGVESAIHHHEGFWGYVYVAEGKCENVEYELSNGELREKMAQVGLPGALIKEKDGVIHKLCNPSKTERAVTIHFYMPPLETFKGMKIFDAHQKRIGVLGDNAKTSSWEEPRSAFESVKENAFTFKPYKELNKASHHIGMVLPKPAQPQIDQMLTDYYNEQAEEYDFFDLKHPSRKAYLKTINQLIADTIIKQQPKKVLSIACGTGRRAIKIREKSGLSYTVFGVDISSEMLKKAENRGVQTLCCDWLNADVTGHEFDVITYLYAFGHLSTNELRLKSLKKAAQHLKPGGSFFFDLFNVNDKHEWGPKALNFYHQHQLHENGYDPGDVFYKKSGGEAYAYLHYFSETEVLTILKEVGLTLDYIKHIGYVNKPGEIFLSNDEGALFVKAIKQ